MLSEAALREGRLCVVGNINRDVKTAPFAGTDRLLRDGETRVEGILETPGGGGANSAFAAAALGARVAFLGKVGADALGGRLARALAQHGVTAALARDPGCATGNSLALTYADGQRHFLSCQPNNESLSFADLQLGILADYRHLFRADIWFSEAMLFGGNARLFQQARAAGLVVSIDLNWDPGWGVLGPAAVARRKAAVREALPWVDVAHGNARELTEFADAASLELALTRLTEWGVGEVVVHLGAEGAGHYRRGQLIVEPAVTVQRHVNATGTGDVLSVCMMLLHDQPDVRAKLRLANTVVSEFIAGTRVLIPPLP